VVVDARTETLDFVFLFNLLRELARECAAEWLVNIPPGEGRAEI
jgi:hypothetical protein